MVAQLGLQTAFQRGLDQSRDQATVTGQLNLAGIDLVEQGIQRTGGPQLLDDVCTTHSAAGFIGHSDHHVPFRWTNPLHRESDTPGAVKAHTAALNALQHMVITAPATLREQLNGMKGQSLITACARLRPGADLSAPVQATKRSLRRLASRCQTLAAEIADADDDLQQLISQTAPGLLNQFGVGVQVAGQLLVTAGDNPNRLHSDASFAALCGASPVPVSSGRTDRHRLSRGGDRDANCALHWVVLARMAHHQPTKDYIARRRAQGLTSKEIIRCLKRYVARELLPLIRQALQPPAATTASETGLMAA